MIQRKAGYMVGLFIFGIWVLTSCGNAALSPQNTVSGSVIVSVVSGSDVFVQGEQWRDLYASHLENLLQHKAKDENYRFLLRDMDGDGALELVTVKDGKDVAVYGYDMDKGQMISMGEHDFETGTIRYLSPSKDSSYPGIFLFHVGGGYEYHKYMSVTGGKLKIATLWDEDFSGISKELGLKRKKIEEYSSDKDLIEESVEAYKKNRDFSFEPLKQKNIDKIRE